MGISHVCGCPRNNGYLSGANEKLTAIKITGSSITPSKATVHFTRALKTTTTDKAMDLVASNTTNYVITFGQGLWGRNQFAAASTQYPMAGGVVAMLSIFNYIYWNAQSDKIRLKYYNLMI